MEYHATKMIGCATKAVLSQNNQNCPHNLSPQSLVNVFIHIQTLVGILAFGRDLLIATLSQLSQGPVSWCQEA